MRGWAAAGLLLLVLPVRECWAQAPRALASQIATVQVHRPAGATSGAFRVLVMPGVRTVGPIEGIATRPELSLSFMLPAGLPAGERRIADVEWEGGGRVPVTVNVPARERVGLRVVGGGAGPGRDSLVLWVRNEGNADADAQLEVVESAGTEVRVPPRVRVAAGDSVRVAARLRAAAGRTPATVVVSARIGGAKAVAAVELGPPAERRVGSRRAVPMALTMAGDGRSAGPLARVDARAEVAPGVTATLALGSRLPATVASALGGSVDRGVTLAAAAWRVAAGEVRLWNALLPGGGLSGTGLVVGLGQKAGPRVELAAARRGVAQGGELVGAGGAVRVAVPWRGGEVGGFAALVPGSRGGEAMTGVAGVGARHSGAGARWYADLGVAGRGTVVGQAGYASAPAAGIRLDGDASRTQPSGGATLDRVRLGVEGALAPGWRVFGRAQGNRRHGAGGGEAGTERWRWEGSEGQVEAGLRLGGRTGSVNVSGGARTVREGAGPAVSGPEASVGAAVRIGAGASFAADHTWTRLAERPDTYSRVAVFAQRGGVGWAFQAERGAPGGWGAEETAAGWRGSLCLDARAGRVGAKACGGVEAQRTGRREFLSGAATLALGRSTDLVVGLEPWAAQGGGPMRSRFVLGVRSRISPGVLPPEVAGSVYDDRNGNGRRDGGEGGVAGVAVVHGELVTRTDAAGRYAFGTVETAAAARIAGDGLEAGWMVGATHRGQTALVRPASVRVVVRFRSIPEDAVEATPAGAVRATASDGTVTVAALSAAGEAEFGALVPGAYRLEHVPPAGKPVQAASAAETVVVAGGETAAVELVAAYPPRRMIRTVFPAGGAGAAAPAAGCGVQDGVVAAGMTVVQAVCALGSPDMIEREEDVVYLLFEDAGPGACGGVDVVAVRDGRVVAARTDGAKRRWSGPRPEDALGAAARRVRATARQRRCPM